MQNEHTSIESSSNFLKVSATEAIQYRLDNAGLQRKIGKNQVRAIRILLSGSQEDMKQIEEADGKLEEW